MGLAEHRYTERLRLEPIGPRHAADLDTIHADPWVAEWYAGSWTRDHAITRAKEFESHWQSGVGKWIAFDRETNELVGRGGLERPEGKWADQMADLLGPEWNVNRLDVGWTLLSRFRGRGYASEIGRAALAVAFDELGAGAVSALTERHNLASRAVMERLGMSFVGEIHSEGLVEGQPGLHPNAPFVVYVLRR